MENNKAKELIKRRDLKYMLDHDYVIFDKKTGKQIESIPNIKADYKSFPKDSDCFSRNIYDFWMINKHMAEQIIGCQITDNEFQNKCCDCISYITDKAALMDIYKNGVLSTTRRNYLSRESIQETINDLNSILENYDQYFEDYMNDQLDLFVENCLKLKREYGLNIPKTTKKTPAVAKNPKGYIYVMKNCGYYKIGKAQIGSSRFGEYTKLPEEPEYVIKVIVGNYNKVETALHERYKNKRLRDGGCEWFELEDSDIEEIRDFVNQYVVEE